MNVVLIITDTQNKLMVGAYGNKRMDTPHLDRLAETGSRFERAYTTCPLCTPARSAIFSGTHPPVICVGRDFSKRISGDIGWLTEQ